MNKYSMKNFMSAFLHIKKLFQFQLQLQLFYFENFSFLKHDLNVALLIMLQTFKTLIKMNMNFTHMIIINTNETEFNYDVVK